MDNLKVFNPSIIPGILYACFYDFCREGIQFCNAKVNERRCEHCDAHFHDCFTYKQESNCTQYCMDQWIQNMKFRNQVTEEAEAEQNTYKVLFFVLLVICGVFAVLCILRKRKRIFSKFKTCTACNDTKGHTLSPEETALTTAQPGRQRQTPSPTFQPASSSIEEAHDFSEYPNDDYESINRHNHRRDADGISHRERIDSSLDNVTHRSAMQSHSIATLNTAPKEFVPSTHQNNPLSTNCITNNDNGNEALRSTLHSGATLNTAPKELVPPSQQDYPIPAKNITSNVQVAETVPFYGLPNNTMRLNNLKGESVSSIHRDTSRHSWDNGRNLQPRHELSSVHSSGYQALSPVDSGCADTGYHSDAVGHGPGQ